MSVTPIRQPITRETLMNTCHKDLVTHMRIQGGSIWIYRCVEHPRLSWSDSLDRKTRTTTRTWCVDQRTTSDLDQALAWLNTPAHLIVALEQAVKGAVQP